MVDSAAVICCEERLIDNFVCETCLRFGEFFSGDFGVPLLYETVEHAYAVTRNGRASCRGVHRSAWALQDSALTGNRALLGGGDFDLDGVVRKNARSVN